MTEPGLRRDLNRESEQDRIGARTRFAGHANAMARRLADGLATIDGVSLAFPVEANEVFPIVPEPAAPDAPNRIPGNLHGVMDRLVCDVKTKRSVPLLPDKVQRIPVD